MADPVLTTLNPLPSATSLVGAPTGSGPATPSGASSVRDLATQFEGLLLSQMMKDMKMSLGGDDDDPEGNDTGPLGDVMTSQLGLALSQAGGFGLGNALSGAMLKQTLASHGVSLSGAALTTPSAVSALSGSRSGSDSDSDESAWLPTSTAGNAPGATETVVPVPSASPVLGGAPVTMSAAQISSKFGWRSDPIDGQTKFHKGLDVAVPTGTTVYAPAGGRVESVGQQTGYGLTVVVEHGNGVETRYAHLSAATVRPGETVAAGDPIAVSGNTGRTTGAHLHFEVRENGQAVDPSGWVNAVVSGPAPAQPTAGAR